MQPIFVQKAARVGASYVRLWRGMLPETITPLLYISSWQPSDSRSSWTASFALPIPWFLVRTVLNQKLRQAQYGMQED